MIKDEKVTPIENEVEDNTIDLSMPEIKRKRIRINGDYSQMIELNLNDINIAKRIDEVYPKLKSLADKVAESDAYIGAEDDLEKAKIFLDKTDAEMRELLDYLFDYPICAVLVKEGSLFDPINGQFRFEYIIEKLSALYTNNFDKEFKKVQDRLSKHTGKYSRKKR